MALLPEATRLAFKQVQYHETLIPHIIDKIIYHKQKLIYFLNIKDTSYLTPFIVTTLNTKSEVLPHSYVSNDGAYYIIEKDIIVSKGIATTRYSGRESSILTKTANASILIRALAYAWRYRQLYEQGVPVQEIVEEEQVSRRTIYKYLNLAYLSPRIVNYIMEGKEEITISLQELFTIASSTNTFKEQEERVFDMGRYNL